MGMKTSRSFFIIMALGAITLAASRADDQPAPSSGQDTFVHPATNGPSDSTGGGGVRKEIKHSNAVAVKEGPVIRNAGKVSEQSFGLSKATTVLAPGVRGRAPATVSLGGLAKASAKHSATVIDGATTKRKP